MESNEPHARLTIDPGGTPLEGKTLAFTIAIMGALQTLTAVADATGTAMQCVRGSARRLWDRNEVSGR